MRASKLLSIAAAAATITGTAALAAPATAASTTQVTAVQNFFKGHGFTVYSVASNRLWVSAKASVTQVEKSFQVTENLYRYRGQVLRANAQAPTIPSTLAPYVSFIGGLADMDR